MKQKKRLLLILTLSLLLVISGLTFFITHKKSPFQDFCKTLFTEQLQKDTLSLHYTLADPGRFDIDEHNTVLPLYSRENALSEYQNTQEQLKQLHSFSTEELSPAERYTHSLLEKALSQELKGKQFFYLQEVFSPSGGTQLQFPILMAEYPFRCKKDIENYLELLKLTPSYFSALCQFEQEKFAKGLGMANYSLEKVTRQCENIITSKSLENNEHFLITTFSERLLDAVGKKIITKKEASAYAAQNRQYLASYFLPAYQDLASFLSSNYGMGKNEAGLAFFTEGNAYYEWLFSTTTGSDIAVAEVYQILIKDYLASMNKLRQDLISFQKTNTLTNKDLAYFPLQSPEEMLSHLQKKMSGDFPAISFADTAVSSAEIKTVTPALEPFTAPAYYLLPPIDDNSQNSIYINESSVPNGLSLYTTLAHEGYPGHLYQTVFYQNYQKDEKIPPLRSLMHYGGYVEGWALYTEFLSYSYAADLLCETTGKEDYRLLYDIYATERKSSLALLSLLDIGIHYYKMDFDRTKELLAAHGITSEESAREIYEYIIEEPCNYPKYYWGYQEILSLKESARKQMGTYYSDYAFHQFFLECGPSDYTTLAHTLKEK